MSIGENIKAVRKEKGLTQIQLAKKANISRSYLGDIEGDRYNPSVETLRAIGTALGVDASFFLASQIPNIYPIDPNEPVCIFPVIGSISAGYDGNAVEEETGDFCTFTKRDMHGLSASDCFVLRVSGDSMYPEIKHGDCVLVQRCSSVESGQIAVILYDGNEATIKEVRYNQGEDWLELIPRNPEYKTKKIEGAELEICRVLGRVIELKRSF